MWGGGGAGIETWNKTEWTGRERKRDLCYARQPAPLLSPLPAGPVPLPPPPSLPPPRTRPKSHRFPLINDLHRRLVQVRQRLLYYRRQYVDELRIPSECRDAHKLPNPGLFGREGGRGARRYKYSVEGAGAGGMGWGRRGSSSVMVRALTPATFSSTLPYPSPHSTPRRGFSCCRASSHKPVPRALVALNCFVLAYPGGHIC